MVNFLIFMNSPKPNPSIGLCVLVFLIFLCSCSKETVIIEETRPPSAGKDVEDIDQFQIKLHADSLKKNERGKWKVLKGLVDEKVFFEDAQHPRTTFHGLPGETYELEWTVNEGANTTRSTVNVSFKPLEVYIENVVPTNSTKFLLSATEYDGGEWSIKGNYAHLFGMSSGGISKPELNTPFIELQGYAYNTYEVTWTARYGSKSASTTILLKAGDYLESEALTDLLLTNRPDIVTYDEQGHVTEIELKGERTGGAFEDTVTYPAVQALVHLKKFVCSGSAMDGFPSVFGDKFRELESLTLEHIYLSGVPENIGNLVKLKELHLEIVRPGSITYALPETFGNLKNLEILSLSALNLRTLPESIGQLTNLREFDFSSNDIERLPEGIGNCRNLEVLTGYTRAGIPRSISKCIKLKSLMFFSREPDVKLPDDFGNLKALENLHLSGCYTKLPASFTELINLNRLIIETNDPSYLIGQLPANFGDLKKLKNVNIAGSFKAIPLSLTNLTDLESLTLEGDIEELPEEIGNLKKLQWLGFSGNNLKRLPESIGNLTNVTIMVLNRNQIEELPISLYGMVNLKRLDLTLNKLSHFSNGFAKMSSTLADLAVNGNPYSEEEFERLRQLLPNTSVY